MAQTFNLSSLHTLKLPNFEGTLFSYSQGRRAEVCYQSPSSNMTHDTNLQEQCSEDLAYAASYCELILSNTQECRVQASSEDNTGIKKAHVFPEPWTCLGGSLVATSPKHKSNSVYAYLIQSLHIQIGNITMTLP